MDIFKILCINLKALLTNPVNRSDFFPEAKRKELRKLDFSAS